MKLEDLKKKYLDCHWDSVMFRSESRELGFLIEYNEDLKVVMYGALAWCGEVDDWTVDRPDLAHAETKEEAWDAMDPEGIISVFINEDDDWKDPTLVNEIELDSWY